jgi:hypothetical protein
MNGSHKTLHSHRCRRTSEGLKAWGRLPVYRARILTSEVVDVVVKSARRMAVGERISFATLSDLAAAESASNSPALPAWRSGVIWRIEKGTLRLTRT